MLLFHYTHMAGQSRVHIYVTAHDFGDHGKFSCIKTIGCLFKQCIRLLLEFHLQYFHYANRMEKNNKLPKSVFFELG